MKKLFIYLLGFLFVGLAFACNPTTPDTSQATGKMPKLYPDYTEVTLPINIAPITFRSENNNATQLIARFEGGETAFVVSGKEQISPSMQKWRELLQKNQGQEISVTLYEKGENGIWLAYDPFKIAIAPEPIDSHLAYRLIEPGYTFWNKMGIYQRCLENFEEKEIYSNEMSGNNCINCHSFCQGNPQKMIFHMREALAGTILIDGTRIEKLNTKTEQTISPLAYPSWHPSGRFIAFSVNNTQQAFHTNNGNRIEVFDHASDVVVYDVERHEIVTTSRLSSSARFEIFPTFSPDGKQLYFCSAAAKPMPESFDSVQYSLCRISFDTDSRRFGETVDTLYNAPLSGGSVSFPRVSPDGKRLMFTRSSYGNFSIWHKDADLWMAHLDTGDCTPLTPLNSNDAESYHSWSQNSRWVVFSSRRDDGLYTRPYMAYIDSEGNARKPFLLPQKEVAHYDRLMQSFNIPELITGEVTVNPYKITQKAQTETGVQVSFASTTAE